MISTRRILAAAALLLACAGASAQTNGTEEKKEWSYIPTFNGEVLVNYRYSPVTGDSRFQVANTRLSAGGYVLPILDYFVQVDFCDNGKIKLLDTYARIHPVKGLSIYAGQMRVPFSVESSRMPYLYYFADVAMTAKFGNLRSVGVKAGYTVPGTALYAEGGVFNSSDMSDHATWNSALTYGIKANYMAKCGLRPEVAFMSRVPSGTGVRLNQYNASLSWKHGRFFVEGEYIYRLYAGAAYNASHAYDFFVDYAFPIKSRLADTWSVQARLDGITDASDGIRNAKGKLETTMFEQHRATVGTKFTRSIGPLTASFKINYEHYFYADKKYTPSASDNNQLVAGVSLHF